MGRGSHDRAALAPAQARDEPGAATTKAPRRSIRAKLFLAVGLPVTVLVLVLSLLSWRGARGAVTESLNRELISVTTLAASTINPATARFLLPGDESTRTYQRLQAKLKAIQAATGSVRVLLLGDDEKVRADADGELPVFGVAPRVALDRAEFERARAGQPSVSVPFEDDSGRRYLAAYARVPEPPRGDDLGVGDGPAMVLVLEAPASLLDATDRVAKYLALLAALAVIAVFGFAALVARTLTSRLTALAEQADRLGQGQLAAPLKVPPGNDEVSLLGHTLEEMRRALLERDRERQMMLAGIAHEVRNPLGGMELFSGLLEESIAELDVAGETREELASHAARVRKELRYLTGVVNDFLDFARDAPIARELVDVTALLEDVRSLSASTSRATITVDSHVAEPFPLDRGRIKEALLNLVENALAASSVDDSVCLRARRVESTLILEVEDSGKGMDEATASRAFTPFFTTRERGSGLGLPLVRKFARDHGGDATLESAPSAGTKVTLRLLPGEISNQAVRERTGSAPRDKEPLLG